MFLSSIKYIFLSCLISFCLSSNAAVVDGVVPSGATNTQVPLNDPTQQITVNIANPNTHGTSFNTYTHFNVPAPGVLLNNQLGNNPNLTSAAKTIINQVTSSNPSFFEGALEVQGTKAHLIVANPNGININGGSFINTGAALVTTGTVTNLGSLGGLLDTLSISTNSGKITVGTNGLSGMMDSLNLISKELEINGQIENSDPRISSRINIITGDSTVITNELLLPGSVGSSYLQSSTGAGTQPTLTPADSIVFNLDQGGITASKISIVITNNGAGVNLSSSSIDARSQLSISSTGKLTIKNTNIKGQGTVNYNANEIELLKDETIANSLNTMDSDDIQMIATTKITVNNADIKSEGNLLLASENIDLISNANDLSPIKFAIKGSTNISTTTLNIEGVQANIGRATNINVANLNIKETQKSKPTILQSESANILVEETFNNEGGNIFATDDITIEAKNFNNIVSADTGTAAKIASDNGLLTLDIEEDLLNQSSTLQGSQVDIAVGDTLRNEYNPAYSSKAIIFSTGTVLDAKNGMNLEAGTAIENYAGRILSNSTAMLTAPLVRNYTSVTNNNQSTKYSYTGQGRRWFFGLFGGRKTIKSWYEVFPDILTINEFPYIVANGDLTINASDKLENTGGQIIANSTGDITINTNIFNNLSLKTGSAFYQEEISPVFFKGNKYKGWSDVKFIGGNLSAGGNLNITAPAQITNQGGSLLAVNNINLTSNNITNTAFEYFRVSSKYNGLKFWKDNGVKSGYMDLGGEIQTLFGDITINSANPLVSDAGLIQAGGDIIAPNGIQDLNTRKVFASSSREDIGVFSGVFKLFGVWR